MGNIAVLVCVIALALTCTAYEDSGNSVCSSPPDVDGAVTPQFTVSEHPIGTVIIYNCPPGYTTLNVTNQISLCGINREKGYTEWTSPKITCNRNSVCSSPPDVDGAVTPQFTVSEHPIGTVIIYNCLPGYASLNVTNQISLCRINTEHGKAEWTPPKITCNYDCEIPEIPGGSVKEEILGDWKMNWDIFEWERTINYTTIQSGSTVSDGTVIWLSCYAPYSVHGNGIRMVRTNCLRGRWASELLCLREMDIVCPPVETSEFYTLQSSNHRRINSTVTFFCKDNGKRIEGSRSLKCLPNGRWSDQIPKCVETDIVCPPVNTSGFIILLSDNHRRINSTVTFFCKDNGTRIEGSCSLNCLPNGTWSGRKPKCVEVTCEEPQSPKHGTVKLHGDLKVGSLATYSCDPGRKLNGNNTAECLISGQWTFDAPECSSVAGCVLNLDPLSRLLVDPMKDVYHVGETISLSCPPREEMSSEVYRIMCLPGGWADSFPNCIKMNK